MGALHVSSHFCGDLHCHDFLFFFLDYVTLTLGSRMEEFAPKRELIWMNLFQREQILPS